MKLKHYIKLIKQNNMRFNQSHASCQYFSCMRGEFAGVRTFVPTDIRSHAIFDRAGHSCSHQMTTPDIRAHIE